MPLASSAGPDHGWRATRSPIIGQVSEVINSRQACSHRRHASAQTRQCSCIEACSSQLSPHDLQAVAHASRKARVTLAS